MCDPRTRVCDVWLTQERLLSGCCAQMELGEVLIYVCTSNVKIYKPEGWNLSFSEPRGAEYTSSS